MSASRKVVLSAPLVKHEPDSSSSSSSGEEEEIVAVPKDMIKKLTSGQRLIQGVIPPQVFINFDYSIPFKTFAREHGLKYKKYFSKRNQNPNNFKKLLTMGPEGMLTYHFAVNGQVVGWIPACVPVYIFAPLLCAKDSEEESCAEPVGKKGKEKSVSVLESH